MKFITAFAFCALLGMGATQLATPSPYAATIVVQDEINPLEEARQAVFMIGIGDYGGRGSAILVGRQRLDDGSFMYRALTAYHVVEDMSRAIIEDGMTASRALYFKLQP